jgi:hypothetical protein
MLQLELTERCEQTREVLSDGKWSRLFSGVIPDGINKILVTVAIIVYQTQSSSESRVLAAID